MEGETWLLCYRGEGKKASASASAGNNLKNVTIRVGITQPALEGSAATRWRVHKEVQDKGDLAALHLMGKVKETAYGPRYNIAKVYEFLNLPPKTTVVEEDDEYVDDDFTCF